MMQGSSSFILLGNYRSKEWLAGISAFLMSAIISASVIWHFDTMRINEMKHKIKDLANENSFYLYKKIDQMMALSYPISSTILEDGQTHDFESIAKKLIVHYPLISEIALAPAGVTRNVIIDKKGYIVYLTRLYNEQEFNEMKQVIELLLKK